MVSRKKQGLLPFSVSGGGQVLNSITSEKHAGGRPHKPNAQCEKLLALLRRFEGQWVPLPRIMSLGIAQYNTRILELRRHQHLRIENRTKWREGVRQSWFSLNPPEGSEP